MIVLSENTFQIHKTFREKDTQKQSCVQQMKAANPRVNGSAPGLSGALIPILPVPCRWSLSGFMQIVIYELLEQSGPHECEVIITKHINDYSAVWLWWFVCVVEFNSDILYFLHAH